MRADEVSGRWAHAHEEDTSDEMVFRPADAELPPSRGRVAFELRADGSFAETGLGPADVPEEATGSWTLEGATIRLSDGAAQGVPREMEVLRTDKERLVVRKPR
ncbi:MAG: hypothetical protein AVDCRST_MAG47-664 [uncultured Nocardioidaceae bacterium]|uniref:Lipocalin-like domain-containing protein n=1 Tax=uncultured Nocardioidaceae bacterium TaxID=253824 RepID=A0A6J4MRG8_9ACTN|nr:MAG: hypothetical protein AVDCRST_MAG47-664 [uncultured Nocardioidaceae bacterium]